MLKVFHAFSGVDSQRMAENRVWGGEKCKTIGTMEIDCDAIISSVLIHENKKFLKHYNQEWNDNQYEQAKEWLKKRNIGFDFEKGKSKLDRMKKDKLKQLYIASVCTRNYGDISLANKIKIKEDIDLFTYSSPCQSFSVAGKQEGLQGVSGLLLECEKFIEINKPKFLLLENVKNLVGKKFIKDFENWLKILDKLGYNSYYEILNAKDFNVPQNRERVFCISIRKDIDKGYSFPKGIGTNKCIQDVLEDNVDDKYYLKQEIVKRFKIKPIGNNIIGTTAPEFRTIGQRDIVYNPNGIMGALTATDYKQPKQIIVVGNIDKKGWFDVEKRVYDKNGLSPTLTTNSSSSPKIITLGNIMPSGHSAGRVVSINGISPTVMENHGLAITIGGNINNKFSIRRLTPRECWKLMDFDDNSFDKVKDYISDSQLYKIAGNSIVVACLEHIFKNLKEQYNL